MSSMTDFTEQAIANHYRGSAYTAPTTLHFALFTAAPSDAGGGTEVSGGAYARAAVTASTGLTAPVNGQVANAAVVNYPTPTAGWGTVTHFAVFDAASAGNMLFHGALTTPRTIATGDTVRFPAGAFTLTFA